jgi:hypothetical protein
MAKVNAAQKLVNDIDSRYGLDASSLTDSEIEALVEALQELLQEDDRDQVESPADFMDSDEEEDL